MENSPQKKHTYVLLLRINHVFPTQQGYFVVDNGPIWPNYI